MELPITLVTAAVAALMSIWLALRVGRVRSSAKIPHGHGDNPLLLKRMRAQANYVEYTPFVVILVAVLEMSGRGGTWLVVVAGGYFLARVAHALGMDNDVAPNGLRGIGILYTILTLLGLALYAVLVAAGLA